MPILFKWTLRNRLLQRRHSISDPAVEEAPYHLVAMLGVAGIERGRHAAQDETTVCGFRHLPKRCPLGEPLLNAVNEYPARNGNRISNGTAVGATGVPTTGSTSNGEGARDPEMHRSARGKHWCIGMKAHVAIDGRHKTFNMVAAWATNVADLLALLHRLRGKAICFCGDQGGQGYARAIRRVVARVRDGAIRRCCSGKRSDEAIEAENCSTSKIRAMATHILEVIKRVFGFERVRCHVLAKSADRPQVSAALTRPGHHDASALSGAAGGVCGRFASRAYDAHLQRSSAPLGVVLQSCASGVQRLIAFASSFSRVRRAFPEPRVMRSQRATLGSQFVRFPLVIGLAGALTVGGCAATPQGESTDPLESQRPNFTGLWQMAAMDEVVIPEADTENLTDEAKARLARFHQYFDPERDDQIKFCVPNGMPWIMLGRARYYVTDIYQTDERITVIVEFMDARRIIHFGQQEPPETFVPSSTGYSVARWEGQELVIETTRLRARSEVGVRQRSDQARILERWRLIDHPKYGRALEIEMTIDDPVIYRRPARGRQLFIPAPEGSTLNWYGCTETLWDDYIRKREEQIAASRPNGSNS